MVGRLVEQQERGGQQQQPGQRGAHAPAAGELGERPRQLVGAEAEAAEDGAGLRLQPVAAERLEAMLQLAVALGQRLARRVVSERVGRRLPSRARAPTPPRSR